MKSFQPRRRKGRNRHWDVLVFARRCSRSKSHFSDFTKRTQRLISGAFYTLSQAGGCGLGLLHFCQTNPCARRAGSKFRVQGSKFSENCETKPFEREKGSRRANVGVLEYYEMNLPTDFRAQIGRKLGVTRCSKMVDKPVNNFLVPGLDRTEPANQKGVRVQTIRFSPLEVTLACQRPTRRMRRVEKPREIDYAHIHIFIHGTLARERISRRWHRTGATFPNRAHPRVTGIAQA